DRMLRGRDWRWSLLLGLCLAMMILGGDPEAAYHALFMSAIYAVVLAWRNPLASGRGQPLGAGAWLWVAQRTTASRGCPADTPGHPLKSFRSRLALICLAAVVGFVLASVQVLPSAEATRYSDRAAFDRPRNIYECAAVFVEWNARPNQNETA